MLAKHFLNTKKLRQTASVRLHLFLCLMGPTCTIHNFPQNFLMDHIYSRGFIRDKVNVVSIED